MPNEDGRKILPEKAEEKCIPSPHVKHHSRHSTSDHDGGIPPPQSRPPVMLRILCLHDGHSNADELSDRLEILGDGLYHNHGIELVYVNAPLLVSSRKPKQHDEEGGDNDYEDEKSKDDFDTNPLSQIPKRVWWEEDEGKEDVVDSQGSEHSKLGEQVKASEDLVETTTTTTITSTEEEATPLRKYVGLDASLLLVRQVWSSMPFWGIIGVGTGAAVASFLPLLPMTRSSAPPPQFMICIRGETILEETELLVDADLSRSCLHLWDEEENEDYDDDGRGNDGDIPSSSSPRKSPSSKERLWRQLGGKIVTGWSHGCLSTRALNLMGKVRSMDRSGMCLVPPPLSFTGIHLLASLFFLLSCFPVHCRAKEESSDNEYRGWKYSCSSESIIPSRTRGRHDGGSTNRSRSTKGINGSHLSTKSRGRLDGWETKSTRRGRWRCTLPVGVPVATRQADYRSPWSHTRSSKERLPPPRETHVRRFQGKERRSLKGVTVKTCPYILPPCLRYELLHTGQVQLRLRLWRGV